MITDLTFLDQLNGTELAAVASALTNKPLGKAATVAAGLARAKRAIGADDVEVTLGNLPSLLRSRNFGKVADKVETLLTSAEVEDDEQCVELDSPELEDSPLAHANEESWDDLPESDPELHAEDGDDGEGEIEKGQTDEPDADAKAAAEVLNRKGRVVRRDAKIARDRRALAPKPPVAKQDADQDDVVLALRAATDRMNAAKVELQAANKALAAARSAFKAANRGGRVGVSTGRPSAAGKMAKLVAMLQADGGATNEEIQRAFGWQPHSVRGAIAGNVKRQMGHVVEFGPRASDGAKAYRIIG
jgi:hypothetical protein